MTLQTTEHEGEALQAAGHTALSPVLEMMDQFGFGSEATHAVRYLRSTLHGFVSLELAGGFGLPQEVQASFDYLISSLTDHFLTQANALIL